MSLPEFLASHLQWFNGEIVTFETHMLASNSYFCLYVLTEKYKSLPNMALQESRICNVPRKRCEELNMPGDRCIVCGNMRVLDSSISLSKWFRMKTAMATCFPPTGMIKPDWCVCSWHFAPNPLGKRFASKKKLWTLRAKRTKQTTPSNSNSVLCASSKSPNPELVNIVDLRFLHQNTWQDFNFHRISV